MNAQDEFDDILKNKLDSQEFPFDETNWEKASGMIDASRNSLRDKLDAEEFPFDEANWEKARKMIDASRRERRPVAIYLTAAGLLLLLCVSGYFFLGSDNTSSSNSGPVAEHKAQNSAGINEAQATNETTANPSNEKNITSSSEQTREAPAEQNENASPVTEGHNTVAAKEAHVMRTERNENNNTTIAKENNTTSEAVNIKKTARTSSGNSASEANKASVSTAVVAKKESKTSASSSQKPSGKQPAAKQEDAAAPKNEASFAGNNPTQLPAATSHNPSVQPVKEEPVTAINPENPASTSQAPLSTDSLATPVIAAAPKADTAGLAVKDSKFRTEKDPVNFIYAEAGTNYLLGWKNMNEKDASGFNPVFGLHFYHQFRNKIGITVGSQYNCVGNLNYSSHTSTVTHYDFGKVDDVTIITPTKIHYVSGVVKLNYAFKKNNIFGIGCNVSYLLNVDNKVETYNQRDNKISQMQISKTSGYIDGFSTYDVQATVSYRRIIYKDFGANIELFYGLTDVKTNGFFNTSFFERNTGMKLTLTYNIFKK